MYFPKRRIDIRRGGIMRQSTTAVFPGYLFIEAEEQEKAFFDFLKRKLTKSDYNLYILKFLEYHSNDEISTILNVKNDTVNKRVTRLKQKLRKIL
jgi:RNA polymerase sigma factor (sigma-70 family)